MESLRPARYDLHLHTTRSDGRFSWDDVVTRCAQGGLDVVAVTDHDALPPVPAGRHVVDGRPIVLIAAAELTVQLGGRELHLLCYFPGPAPAALVAMTSAQQAARRARYEAARAHVGGQGLPSAEDLRLAGVVSPTRHHLARSLVRAGRARDVHDAFARLLRGCCPPLGPTMAEAAATVRAAGGISSWAHPSVDDARRLLPAVAACGVDAIEAVRPSLSSRDRRTLKKMASAVGLFVTGGSDWHGWGEPDLGLFALTAPELERFVSALGSPAEALC